MGYSETQKGDVTLRQGGESEVECGPKVEGVMPEDSEQDIVTRTTTYAKTCKEPKWIEAMHAEIQALTNNITWELVDLPKGKSAIGCRWIYKMKYKSTGEVERFKTRLVAKGYSQKEGIDYKETFFLVVKMVT
ncbi:uncharacterized mitochondrial protein AtMg00820-like, partial [Solanum verrucosum]|uniref:uncharacterized mitochondrial protein AtMg00820-like n=1 Tax=Solanum verrucosum TaxID=315347 RepID=UPI0020D19EF5